MCVLLFLIGGCGSAISNLETLPVAEYQESKNINLSVELIISKEFDSYSHLSSGEELVLGPLLVKNSENMARNLFRQIIVSKKENFSQPSSVDAVLIPTVVSVAHTRPMCSFSDRKLSMNLQWQLKDTKGKIVWVDTVEGEGINNLGSTFTYFSNTRERVQLLMEDLFEKSYISISSSKEIKNFKPEI